MISCQGALVQWVEYALFITIMDKYTALIPSVDQITLEDINKGDLCPDGNVQKEAVLKPKRPKGWGKRHTVAVLGFYAMVNAYAMRFNLSMAVVAMIKSHPKHLSTSNRLSGLHLDSKSSCAAEEGLNNDTGNNEKQATDTGEFDWDDEDKGIILASFFWGYIITQLPGGFVSSKIGGKWPIGVGIGLSGCMTFLIPFAARMNMGMLLYCRVIQGLAQGVIYPAMQQMVAAWAPRSERSIFSGVIYSGSQFGAALTMITSGYLVAGSGGWPSVFYFTGVLTFVWLFLWLWLVYNSPSEHPTISDQERMYIQASIGYNRCSDLGRSTPWKAILTSRLVWTIALAELCNSWGLYTLLMELPTYFKTVLNFDMKENSWLSASPQILMWMFAICSTSVADICIAKKLAKTVTIRKICHTIAEVGAGLFLIGAALVGCDRTAAVLLLIFAAGVTGAVNGGYVPNQVEIGWHHAGVIVGITNTVGNLAGFGVSIVASYFTQDNVDDPSGWMCVFFIAAGIYFLGALIYVCFTTCEEQPWNRESKSIQDS